GRVRRREDRHQAAAARRFLEARCAQRAAGPGVATPWRSGVRRADSHLGHAALHRCAPLWCRRCTGGDLWRGAAHRARKQRQARRRAHRARRFAAGDQGGRAHATGPAVLGRPSTRRKRMDIPNASPGLYNEDLAPAKDRRWGAFSIFNVWTSDVHSLWGYYLAAGLFLLCGSFLNFIIAIGLGSVVIFLLMNLIGYAGVKTGVPYPVLARASFGIWGANVPALVRAIVACFWYGAQTAAASGAIVALLIRTDTLMAFHKSTHFLGHSGLEVICFVVVWALQLLIIQHGMETVRRFNDWAGPAVWVMMLILAIGLVVKAGGFSFSHTIPMDVLLEKTKDAGVPGTPGTFASVMAVAATWVTYFAALYLNFCDFSRFARDERAVRVGNLWGLPVNLILFTLVAGVTTIAAFHVYNEVLLHPDQISAKFENWFLALL